jgi:hypothetical protein
MKFFRFDHLCADCHDPVWYDYEAGELVTHHCPSAASLTGCWKCSEPYPISREACPFCGAVNGNVDLERAQREAEK